MQRAHHPPLPLPSHISLLHLSKETMANKIFHEEKEGLQGGKCIALSNPNAAKKGQPNNSTCLLIQMRIQPLNFLQSLF